MHSRKHRRPHRRSHRRLHRRSHRRSHRRFRGGNPILDLGNNINNAVTDLTTQANAHSQVKKVKKSLEISNVFLNDMKNTLGDNAQEKLKKAKELYDSLTQKRDKMKAEHKKVNDKQIEEINKLNVKIKKQEAIIQNLSSKPPLVKAKTMPLKANSTPVNPKPMQAKPPLVKAKKMPLKANSTPTNSKPVLAKPM